MSKERIIHKGKSCSERVKGNKCGHYSFSKSQVEPNLFPSGAVETKGGGYECGMLKLGLNIEKCVIPSSGAEDVEITSYKD